MNKKHLVIANTMYIISYHIYYYYYYYYFTFVNHA